MGLSDRERCNLHLALCSFFFPADGRENKSVIFKEDRFYTLPLVGGGKSDAFWISAKQQAVFPPARYQNSSIHLWKSDIISFKATQYTQLCFRAPNGFFAIQTCVLQKCLKQLPNSQSGCNVTRKNWCKQERIKKSMHKKCSSKLKAVIPAFSCLSVDSEQSSPCDKGFRFLLPLRQSVWWSTPDGFRFSFCYAYLFGWRSKNALRRYLCLLSGQLAFFDWVSFLLLEVPRQ